MREVPEGALLDEADLVATQVRFLKVFHLEGVIMMRMRRMGIGGSPKIMLIVFDILERMTPGEIRQNPINGHLGKEVLLNHPQVVLTDVQL